MPASSTAATAPIPCRSLIDVLVVGDGLAALAAALTARARGQTVCLAAAGTTVAAELTAALYGEVAAGATGVLGELAAAVAAQHGVHGGWLDPVVAELSADALLTAHDVELLLFATPIALVPGAAGQAGGVLFGSKEGLFTIAAGAIVDATEQGALFRQSGVPFTANGAACGRRTLYFEFAAPGEVDSAPFTAAGFTCRARRTWPDQVVVLLDAVATAPDGDHVAALQRQTRLAIPALAAAARAHLPALADAMLSVTGHRVLLTAGDTLATPTPSHPRYANVCGAGPWVANTGWGDLAALAQLGEVAGAAAAKVAGAPVACSATAPAPAVMTCDVAVAGGGTAGALAGLAAATQGARTVLCESGQFLGGIGTGGGIHIYYHGVPGGLQDRVDDLTTQYTRLLGPPARIAGFHPEAKKAALEQLATDAGLTMAYGAVITTVLQQGGRVTGVLVALPGRLLALHAAVTVDSSGDGDLCAAAGARFSHGRETDGANNFFSVVPGIRSDGRCAPLNFDGGVVDATSIADLTRARRLGLSHLRRPEGFTPANRFNYLSPHVGLRESRQIITDYVLTVDDQVSLRRFPDAIAYGSCHLDDHRQDFHQASREVMFWHWGLGFWDRWIVHELPLRSLLPQGVDGLLIACRALGVSTESATLFRMQRDMQRVGEAAGITAALAATRGLLPRQVPAADVQAVLRARGAMREPAELWASDEGPFWNNSVYRQDLPVAELPSAAELGQRLERSWGSVLLWQLVHQPAAGTPLLRAVLAAGGPHARWWATVGLAMLGQADAAPVLLHALTSRDATIPLPPDWPDWHSGWKAHTATRWLTAAVLLGHLKCAAAVAPIAALLSDESTDLVFYEAERDRLLRCGAAVRALGLIGDPAAAPALRQFLARTDGLVLRHGAHRRGHPWLRDDVGFDLAWALRLPAIEALTAVGAPDPAAALPYLSHPEPTVRRYAQRVHAAALRSAS